MKLLSSKEWQELELAKAELPKLKRLNEREARLDALAKQLKHDEKQMQEEFELKEKKVIAALEDKMAKKVNEMTANHQQEVNNLKANHQRELADVEKKANERSNKKLEKMMEENYNKLKDSMAKLHEEGNAQTKFVQDLAKDMVKSVGASLPLNKHQLQIEENKTIVTKGK